VTSWRITVSKVAQAGGNFHILEKSWYCMSVCFAGRVLASQSDRSTPETNLDNLFQNQELVMKALITAFALLSFVAASTVPLITKAQAQTEQTTPKKKMAKKKKATKKVASDKKKTSKAKMKKPSQA